MNAIRHQSWELEMLQDNSRSPGKSVPASKQPIHVALAVLRMDTGGAERCIARIASGLDRDNFRISVLCFDRSGPAADWITRNDVEVVQLHLATGNNSKAVKAVAGALRTLKPDIVHSHNWGTLLETHLAAKRVGSVAHIHAERGIVLGTNRCGSVKKYLRAQAMKWVCRRCAALTTNAYSVAAKMSRITRIPQEKIHVIPNGLDLPAPLEELASMGDACRRQLGIHPNELIVGSVGRLVEVKGLQHAISAIAQVHARTDSKPHLLLVGDGPLRGPLQDHARSQSIERFVHFVGKQANVWKYLAAMDLYINSSTCEGMSQSILEAMAAGLPVIATDVGDTPRMLVSSRRCGIVVKESDPAALAEAIVALSGKEQRIPYSENAILRHREEFSLSRMLRNYEQLYRQVAVTSFANHSCQSDSR